MSKEKLKKSVEVSLESSVPYHAGGEEVHAKSVTLYPPKGKHRKRTQGIKQGFFRAIEYHRKSGDEAADDGKKVEKEISGEEVYAMIMMSDADLDRFEDDFRKLLTTEGICKVDGEVDLTTTILDELSDNDYDKIVGAYLGNFIVSYLMKSLKKS